MANLSAPTATWTNRTRGLAVVLAYLIDLGADGLGVTTDFVEATHIEVLLADGTVGVDVIGNYAAPAGQQIAIGAEVIALNFEAVADPLVGVAVVFTRPSTATYVAEV